jgi:hypothetical protein
MPENLTGYDISDVYSSFLHLSSFSLSSTLVPVYDGVGNKSTLQLSTTSASISNLNINNISYPQSIGPIQGVVVSDGISQLSIKSIVSVLTSINANVPADGVYSSPVITIANNQISQIISSLDNKTFFYPTRLSTQTGPSKQQLLEVVSWNSPQVGDKLNVLQKVTNGSTLVDLAVNVFTYTSTGWSDPVTY